MCESVVTTAQNRCPPLIHKAKFVQVTFQKGFRLFAATREIYDSGRALTDTDITDLGKYKPIREFLMLHFFPIEIHIDQFLEFYRDSFPKATITPKIHMLEDHMVDFFRNWKVGLGFLGEQGAESIHARFNSIRRNYVNMPNRVQQLEYIMKEHFNQICPDNIVRQPSKPKKRKTKE